jgi:hypothetical protein
MISLRRLSFRITLSASVFRLTTVRQSLTGQFLSFFSSFLLENSGVLPVADPYIPFPASRETQVSDNYTKLSFSGQLNDLADSSEIATKVLFYYLLSYSTSSPLVSYYVLVIGLYCWSLWIKCIEAGQGTTVTVISMTRCCC